jgi:hypothetical protein
LDVVGVVPVSQWSLPSEARPSRITTAYTIDDYGGTVGPITMSPTDTPCAAQAVVLAKAGCMLYDEQMENGGFELCANKYWGFFDPATGYYISLDTMPLNRTAMGPYGFQSDEVHSGQYAMRIVFKDEMKDTSIRLYSQSAINACVERSYTGRSGLSKAATMLARSSSTTAQSVAAFSPQVANGPNMKDGLMSHLKATSLKGAL